MKLTLAPTFFALAAAAAAQPHATPLLSIADARFSEAQLYRIDLAGRTETVAAFPFLVHPETFTLHHDNRTLALHATNPDAVVLFDPTTASFGPTLHSGAPLGNIYAVRPWHTGDYLVADRGSGGAFVRIVDDAGTGVRTVFAHPEWDNQIHALAQDLLTGDILAGVLQIGPQVGPSLIRIDPDTGAFDVLDPAPRNITSLVQDHRDGAVVYGEYSGGIHRRAPSGAIETLIPASTTLVKGTSLAFDRAPGNGILIAGGGGAIVRIAFDPGGPASIVAVHDDLPPFASIAKDLAFERGENVIPVREARGLWRFEIDFAGEASRPYLLALSASGFTPGVPLAGRTLPLVPDGLLVASLTGALAPLLQGGAGTLDADGHATATLDLRPFGGALAGVRLWAAALTIDAGAPGRIATISRPRIVVLD